MVLCIALGTVSTIAGSAAGQALQTVEVSITSETPTPPDELPGDYRVPLTVTVETSGSRCLCQETTVDLKLDDSGPVDEVSFSPNPATIEWPISPAASSATHTYEANATLTVPADANLPQPAVVSANVSHEPSQFITTRIQLTEIELAPPGEDSEQAQPASTSSSNDEAPSEPSPVPGAGAALAASVVATAAISVRRRA